jgi:hypothetical protein
MVALARIVLSKRERVIMLEPFEKGLVGTTLRYPYEVRDAKDYFDEIPDIKVAPDMLKYAASNSGQEGQGSGEQASRPTSRAAEAGWMIGGPLPSPQGRSSGPDLKRGSASLDRRRS